MKYAEATDSRGKKHKNSLDLEFQNMQMGNVGKSQKGLRMMAASSLQIPGELRRRGKVWHGKF